MTDIKKLFEKTVKEFPLNLSKKEFLFLNEFYDKYSNSKLDKKNIDLLCYENTDVIGLYIEEGLADLVDAGAKSIGNAVNNAQDRISIRSASKNKPMIASIKDGAWHFYIFNDLDLKRPGHSQVLDTFIKNLDGEKTHVVPLSDPLRREASRGNTTQLTFPGNNSKKQLMGALDKLSFVVDSAKTSYQNINYVSPEELDSLYKNIVSNINVVQQTATKAKQEDAKDIEQTIKQADAIQNNQAQSKGQEAIPPEESNGAKADYYNQYKEYLNAEKQRELEAQPQNSSLANTLFGDNLGPRAKNYLAAKSAKTGQKPFTPPLGNSEAPNNEPFKGPGATQSTLKPNTPSQGGFSANNFQSFGLGNQEENSNEPQEPNNPMASGKASMGGYSNFTPEYSSQKNHILGLGSQNGGEPSVSKTYEINPDLTNSNNSNWELPPNNEKRKQLAKQRTGDNRDFTGKSYE